MIIPVEQTKAVIRHTFNSADSSNIAIKSEQLIALLDSLIDRDFSAGWESFKLVIQPNEDSPFATLLHQTNFQRLMVKKLKTVDVPESFSEEFWKIAKPFYDNVSLSKSGLIYRANVLSVYILTSSNISEPLAEVVKLVPKIQKRKDRKEFMSIIGSTLSQGASGKNLEHIKEFLKLKNPKAGILSALKK